MTTEVMTTPATDITTDATIEVTVDPMVRQLNMMAELLDTLGKTSKALTGEMKMLTRDVNKMRIAATKGKGKRVKKVVDPDAPRKLGALEKPVPITEELAEFLGIAKGEMFSRQFITQSINKYVKFYLNRKRVSNLRRYSVTLTNLLHSLISSVTSKFITQKLNQKKVRKRLKPNQRHHVLQKANLLTRQLPILLLRLPCLPK
jgi:chromatin remodeling complex protein RSC6